MADVAEPVVAFAAVLVLESRFFWRPVREVIVDIDVVFGTLVLIKSSCLLPKELLPNKKNWNIFTLMIF